MNTMSQNSGNTITFPLDLPHVKITEMQKNEYGDYSITIESTKGYAICQHCGRKTTKLHDYGDEIALRHLPILGHRVYLRLRPKRYECSHCNGKTTTQKLPWYKPRSPHTQAYDEYLLLLLINSTIQDVSRKENAGYGAVEGTIDRTIYSQVNWEEHKELGIIGIDEIAMQKGRKNYVAIITTQQVNGSVAVLGVLGDRKKETVREFLENIPERLRRTMQTVCTDMWDGYVNAAEEFTADHREVSLEVVIDRFHVAKNYRDAVDQVRKQETRRLKKELSEPAYREIVKGTLWIVRKNNSTLEPEERTRLRLLFEYSPKLKVGYTLREELTSIFDTQLAREEGQKRLIKWRDKVIRSGLTCFDKFLTTLDNWLDKIANYFTERLSSGFVEGLNNKIKTIKRRCYGILCPETLFQRLYLDLEGYRLFDQIAPVCVATP
ncbi:MAG: ISL3 family transposase [Anaerolineae bacterium]|nr:ISL3 family transposase [Anaerolineae bacterium]